MMPEYMLRVTGDHLRIIRAAIGKTKSEHDYELRKTRNKPSESMRVFLNQNMDDIEDLLKKIESLTRKQGDN